LLVDIFENFCDSCGARELWTRYYYILPDFTWDAMLKHTRISFKLLTDIDIVMFIERDIRGGLTRRIPQLPTEFFNELWCGGRLGKYKIMPPKLAVDTQPFSRM